MSGLVVRDMGVGGGIGGEGSGWRGGPDGARRMGVRPGLGGR